MSVLNYGDSDRCLNNLAAEIYFTTTTTQAAVPCYKNYSLSSVRPLGQHFFQW